MSQPRLTGALYTVYIETKCTVNVVVYSETTFCYLLVLFSYTYR